MAHDAYRGSPSSYEPAASQDDIPESRAPQSPSYIPPYPSQYTSDQIPMPQPRMPSPHQYAPPSWNPNTQGHVNDAVASAVNKAENSGSIAPELISQITATVIQQLKAYGLDNLQGQQQQQHQTGPPPQASSRTESSPSGTASNSHTTPSSESHDFEPFQKRPTQPSRTSPRPSATTFIPERKESPSSHYNSDHGQKEYRPKAPERVSTSGEMTTLEKIWGKLFEDGKPTPRLGQFLRGIAVHLVGATILQKD
jgi:hypothetical protein